MKVLDVFEALSDEHLLLSKLPAGQAVVLESQHPCERNANIWDVAIIPGAIGLHVHVDGLCCSGPNGVLAFHAAKDGSKPLLALHGFHCARMLDFDLKGDRVWLNFRPRGPNEWGYKVTVTPQVSVTTIIPITPQAPNQIGDAAIGLSAGKPGVILQMGDNGAAQIWFGESGTHWFTEAELGHLSVCSLPHTSLEGPKWWEFEASSWEFFNPLNPKGGLSPFGKLWDGIANGLLRPLLIRVLRPFSVPDELIPCRGAYITRLGRTCFLVSKLSIIVSILIPLLYFLITELGAVCGMRFLSVAHIEILLIVGYEHRLVLAALAPLGALFAVYGDFLTRATGLKILKPNPVLEGLQMSKTSFGCLWALYCTVNYWVPIPLWCASWWFAKRLIDNEIRPCWEGICNSWSLSKVFFACAMGTMTAGVGVAHWMSMWLSEPIWPERSLSYMLPTSIPEPLRSSMGSMLPTLIPIPVALAGLIVAEWDNAIYHVTYTIITILFISFSGRWAHSLTHWAKLSEKRARVHIAKLLTILVSAVLAFNIFMRARSWVLEDSDACPARGSSPETSTRLLFDQGSDNCTGVHPGMMERQTEKFSGMLAMAPTVFNLPTCIAAIWMAAQPVPRTPGTPENSGSVPWAMSAGASVLLGSLLAQLLGCAPLPELGVLVGLLLDWFIFLLFATLGGFAFCCPSVLLPNLGMLTTVLRIFVTALCMSLASWSHSKYVATSLEAALEYFKGDFKDQLAKCLFCLCVVVTPPCYVAYTTFFRAAIMRKWTYIPRDLDEGGLFEKAGVSDRSEAQPHLVSGKYAKCLHLSLPLSSPAGFVTKMGLFLQSWSLIREPMTQSFFGSILYGQASIRNPRAAEYFMKDSQSYSDINSGVPIVPDECLIFLWYPIVFSRAIRLSLLLFVWYSGYVSQTFIDFKKIDIMGNFTHDVNSTLSSVWENKSVTTGTLITLEQQMVQDGTRWYGGLSLCYCISVVVNLSSVAFVGVLLNFSGLFGILDILLQMASTFVDLDGQLRTAIAIRAAKEESLSDEAKALWLLLIIGIQCLKPLYEARRDRYRSGSMVWLALMTQTAPSCISLLTVSGAHLGLSLSINSVLIDIAIFKIVTLLASKYTALVGGEVTLTDVAVFILQFLFKFTSPIGAQTNRLLRMRAIAMELRAARGGRRKGLPAEKVWHVKGQARRVFRLGGEDWWVVSHDFHMLDKKWSLGITYKGDDLQMVEVVVPDNTWALWTLRIEGTATMIKTGDTLEFVQTFAGESTGYNTLPSKQASVTFYLEVDGVDPCELKHDPDASQGHKYSDNLLGKLEGAIKEIVVDACAAIFPCQVNVKQVSAATMTDYAKSFLPHGVSTTFEVVVLPIIPYSKAFGSRGHRLEWKRHRQIEATQMLMGALNFPALEGALEGAIRAFMTEHRNNLAFAHGAHAESTSSWCCAQWAPSDLCVRMSAPAADLNCLGHPSLDSQGATLVLSTELWTLGYHEGKGRLVKYEPHDRGFWIGVDRPWNTDRVDRPWNRDAQHPEEAHDITKITFVLHACTEQVDNNRVKSDCSACCKGGDVGQSEWCEKPEVSTDCGDGPARTASTAESAEDPIMSVQSALETDKPLCSPLDLMLYLWPSTPGASDRASVDIDMAFHEGSAAAGASLAPAATAASTLYWTCPATEQPLVE